MSRERTPAGNILALARSRKDQAKEVEESATSYMPTDIDLEMLMPDEGMEAEAEAKSREPQGRRQPAKTRNPGPLPPKGIATDAETKRKRVSLYLDDDVLTKIFRVSLERHEQLSSATHRLIAEALKARGL